MRLSLESLEAREVPAAYYWSPTIGNSSAVPDNWLMGPGVPYAQHTEAPNGDDDLIFRGDVTQAHCTLAPTVAPSAGQPHFRSLELLFSPEYGSLPGFPEPPPEPYLGTVTVAGSFAVGDLVVECGSLFQADPDTVNHPTAPHAGTLTVMLALDWTGGTLNSNTVAGNIILAPGTTSVAEPSFTNPGINGVVKLGSTLTLQGNETTQIGSSLEMIGGTFEVSRGQLVVGAFCNLSLIADEKADPLKATIKLEKKEDGTQTDAFLKVNAKGTATVKTTRTGEADTPGEASLGTDTSNGAVKNHGTLIITDRTKLKLKPKPNVADSFAQYTQATSPDAPNTSRHATGDEQFDRVYGR